MEASGRGRGLGEGREREEREVREDQFRRHTIVLAGGGHVASVGEGT